MKIITIFILAYLLIALFVYLQQEKLLFYPNKSLHELPAKEGGGGLERKVEEYSLERPADSAQKKAVLRGWLINPRYAKERFVLYFGGNAEDVFLNIEDCSEIDAAILFVNYRGYGSSSGKPTEAAMFSDALALYDDIEKRFAPQKFFAMGRSLGSGIAAYLAAERKTDGIILATPYYSIARIAAMRYPWLPVNLLLKHKFETFRYAKKITEPVTIIYGGADRTVPPRHTRDLIPCFHAPVKEVFIEKGEHGTIDMHPEYWQAILQTIFEN